MHSAATASASLTTPIQPSTREAMDRSITELERHRLAWTATSVRERIELLGQLARDFATVADRWTAAAIEAEGLDPAQPVAGEEALVGPYFVLRNLRLLRRSLEEVERHGRPRIPGPVRTLPTGQVSAQVFPLDLYDRLFYPGVTAEVWMEPGVTAETLPETMAVAYHAAERRGGVALVLGAGNVSSIGPMDALYKLFVEDKVVLYKAHPVTAYLGPLLAEGFQVLVDRGFLRIAYGGAEEGAYLCRHPGVDEIHITGSDRTYEAIVFGIGPDAAERKREGRPLLDKRITAELGNVTPVIVVPGPPGTWSAGDIAYHAENVVTMLANNAGFNCTTGRVLVQHAEWLDRERLLAAIRKRLAQLPPRRAFYPGARERWESFVAAHPEAERWGEARQGELPWTFIPGLDPRREDDVCFTTEAFCGLAGEAPIRAGSVPEFIERAVAFCNDTLWGTLNVTLIVHPKSLADPEVKRAIERAVADLRYGTVSINHWSAIGYGLVVTPWGAFPGSDARDIQSGQGVVHNTLLFSRPQKTVARAPFRNLPKPVWFASHRTAHELTPKLWRFELEPALTKLPGIFSLALRG